MCLLDKIRRSCKAYISVGAAVQWLSTVTGINRFLRSEAELSYDDGRRYELKNPFTGAGLRQEWKLQLILKL